MSVRFGTAGVPHQSGDSSTLAGLVALSSLGLGCLEMEFVQRVTMGEKMAALVRDQATRLGILLSVHAPYYINFNAHDPEILLASRKRLANAARIGTLAGATDIIFHPGFYLGDDPDQTFRKVQRELSSLIRELHEAGVTARLRSETTGKHNQFGSLEETLKLVLETPGLGACIDFSHLHARSPYRDRGDFRRDLERIAAVLGEVALHDLHLHLSGMNYTKAGERNHLNFEESDFPFREMLHAMLEIGVCGRIVCESPNLEEDALLMQENWRQLGGD
jgi:deoxyribonuclease-4